MIWTLAIAFVFLVLVVLEWRSRSRTIRALTLCIALGLFWFARPIPYRALRTAVELEPVTQDLWNPSQKTTEFRSGLFTMFKAIQQDWRIGESERVLSLGLLTWLALNPVLRRKPGLDRIGPTPPTSEPQAPSTRAA